MPELVRFGPFELDLESSELHRNGQTLRLPEPQFEILRMLLLQSGGEVSRDEIRRKLWPKYTALELDISVTSAMLDLRLALGDNGDKPVFIETLAKRGYRFMVPAEKSGKQALPPPPPEANQNSLVIRKVSNYRVRGVLGGAEGLLFKGEDPKANPHVALRFKADEAGADSQTAPGQEGDDRTAALLSHPSICTIYEVEDKEGMPSIVMELLEGETLQELMSSRTGSAAKGRGGLPLGQLRDIGLQIAEALNAMHVRAIIHGNIRPSNIFVTASGEAKIMDFGGSKAGGDTLADAFREAAAQHAPVAGSQQLVVDTAQNYTVMGKGTPGYMSPEQFLGEVLDARTDLFSFGLILFEMATGQRPFPGKGEIVQNALLFQPIPSIKDVNPALPDDLEAIIRKALDRDPDLRFRSAAEMVAELQNLGAEDGATVSQTSVPIAPVKAATNGHIQSAAKVDPLPDPKPVQPRIEPRPSLKTATAAAPVLEEIAIKEIAPPPEAIAAAAPKPAAPPEAEAAVAPTPTPPSTNHQPLTVTEAHVEPEPVTPVVAEEEDEPSRGWPVALAWMAGVLVILGLAAAAFLNMPKTKSVASVRVSKIEQLTRDGQSKDLRGTDGSTLYFTLDASHQQPVAEMSVTGGPVLPIPLGLPNSHVADVSPDGSTLLVRSFVQGKNLAYPLWSIRLADNAMRHLPDAFAANWSSDGKYIIYSTADGGVYLIHSEGGGTRKMADVGGPASSFSWSPDGGAIRFSKEGKIYEMSSNGSNPLQMFPGWHPASWQCCGRWAPDGKYYFLSDGQIWMLDDRLGPTTNPAARLVQVTSGPIVWSEPIPSKDGLKLYASGNTKRGELIRFDPYSKQFQRYLNGVSAEFVSFSRDGNVIAWVSYPDGVLWRANRDGSNPIQLTTPPLYPRLPEWSPDGSQILFVSLPPGGSHLEIETISSQGGKPQQLIADDDGDETGPDWSPDGRQIVFSTSPEMGRYPQSELRILNLDTHQISKVPDSEGLYEPRWSPDGKMIAAKTSDGQDLKVCALGNKTWWRIRHGSSEFPTWSKDSVYLYYLDSSGSAGIYRIAAKGGHAERVVELKDIHSTGYYGSWMGLDPTDAPLLLSDAGGSDLYALTLEPK
jgi:serine/threonine protein kinase/Tol biopolymer transport system component